MTKNVDKIVEQWKTVRRAGVPIVAIETPDPAALIHVILSAMNGKKETTPIVQWDLVRGSVPLSQAGSDWNTSLEISSDPVGFLDSAMKSMPENGIVFFLAGHKLMDQPVFVQAVWNLRDAFKSNGRTLALLGPLAWKLPIELKDDIVPLVDPLPNAEKLSSIITNLAEDANVVIEPEAHAKTVDAITGLSAFGAEQVVAMSMSKDGINQSSLWNKKVKAIEQTPGLSVWRGGESFKNIGGCENVKAFMSKLAHGARRPKVVLFIDEIEKGMAGAQGDTSGVSQDFMGTFLSWTQDKGAAGCIFIGPPGSGKSFVAKAMGSECECPTVAFDFNGMKASLVGESGSRLRTALAVVESIGQGNVLVLATCNSITSLPPELRRRFTLGTFFFDLLSAEERSVVWKIYLKKYGINEEELEMLDDGQWTGAEIRQCCDITNRLGCSLNEASQYIVPVAKSASDQIEALRKMASGKFLNASKPGLYRYEIEQAPTRRRMQ